MSARSFLSTVYIYSFILYLNETTEVNKSHTNRNMFVYIGYMYRIFVQYAQRKHVCVIRQRFFINN